MCYFKIIIIACATRCYFCVKSMCLLTYMRLCVTVVGAKPVSDLSVSGRYASTIYRSSTCYGICILRIIRSMLLIIIIMQCYGKRGNSNSPSVFVRSSLDSPLLSVIPLSILPLNMLLFWTVKNSKNWREARNRRELSPIYLF